eukprot:TRINITY_DN2691_c0_g2_i1.p1 TRINITY_DN2691_c0_g2~~TRINITY_DN2691_c0_g2_i1.p1  ORF type:complete len:279 (+),score=52.88 TRINITY_DN2691_c0_g2_i1:62-898(+)
MAAELVVTSLIGEELFRCDTIPDNVGLLKEELAAQLDMSSALIKLLREDGVTPCGDEEKLEPVSQSLIFVIDDTPQWSWDLQGNPDSEELEIDEHVLKCPEMRRDYVNVLTKEPVTVGTHYFEFHMHFIGDEQWCGVTADKTLAGRLTAVPSEKGWTYYCGRVGRTRHNGDHQDGKGSLQAVGHVVKEFKTLEPSGDVINMLVDCDTGGLAFALNGKMQGACEIPKATPLWVLTHVDTRRDHVELRKLALDVAPADVCEALRGALLNVSAGKKMTRRY